MQLIKKTLVPLLCAALVSITLAGCEEPPEPTTLPTTAPSNETIMPEIPVVYAPKSFTHCGLQIDLDESYKIQTTSSENVPLRFENESVRGGIEFGTVEALTAGMAATAEDFAQYLRNSLNPYISGLSVGSTAEGRYHVVIPSGSKTLIRGLYTSGNVGWSVWLETEDATQVENLTVIIDSCTILPEQSPDHALPGQSVELSGLILKGQAITQQERSDDSLTAVIDSIPCCLTTGSIALLTNNITPAIMAQEALDALEEGVEAELAVENEVDALIVPTADGHTVTGYYIRNGRFWTVTAEGADRDALLALVTSATTDDLSFTRLLRYDLSSYASLDALLQELEQAGQSTWGRYTLRLDGMITPVTLRLYGTRLESIQIYNHTVEIPQNCHLQSGGNCILSQQEELLILNIWDLNAGYTWIFTPTMSQYYYPTGGTSLMVYPDEAGGLKFSHHSLRFNHSNMTKDPYAPLEQIINRKEFYFEEGEASIVDGQLTLNPQTSNAISDVFALDELFAAASDLGLYPDSATVDDLLFQNLIEYPR